MTQILALDGSVSGLSPSHPVLESAQEILAHQGMSMEILRVGDLPREALTHAQFDHPAITTAAAKVAAARAVIILTPIYGTANTGLMKTFYTGSLKALLDLLPRKVLVNKPVLPMATGRTLSQLLVIDYALNPVLRVLGAAQVQRGLFLVESQLQQRPDQGVKFLDPDLEYRFHTALTELVHATTAAHTGIMQGHPSDALESYLTTLYTAAHAAAMHHNLHGVKTVKREAQLLITRT